LQLLVNNNNLWSCDANVACHMATRLTSGRNTLWLVTLTSHHDSCHWFDELIMIQSSMWWWHGMPFGNKVSQIFMAIHKFLWPHKFLCVLNLWHQYLSWHVIIFYVPRGFWNHECTCMYTCIKQSIVNCNYDYNINSHFEKGDT
jgi:hypothetical protein